MNVFDDARAALAVKISDTKTRKGYLISRRLTTWNMVKDWRRGVVFGAAAAAIAICTAAAPGGEGLRFRADEWVTECDPGGATCSITAPFSGEQGSHSGSFALVVMLQNDAVAVVGQPYPTQAVLRVDKNPAIECHQTRYCLFPADEARAFIRELRKGSLVLVDVAAGGAAFHFSLTPKGYQAGLAKLAASGYRFPDAEGR